MSEKYITSITTILIAIVGVAVLALLVSQSAKTGDVIGAGSSGFARMLCTALSPIGVQCGGGNARALIPDVNSTIRF